MRTTVRLPEQLLARAKRRALQENKTLTALIEEGLRLVLAKSRTPARRRKLPRVSSARGGLMPGIDIVKTSELLDDDELPLEKRR